MSAALARQSLSSPAARPSSLAGARARDDDVAVVERRVALGDGRRAGARRGSPRARARSARSARASGCGLSSSRRRPSALRTMPASRHSAARVARVARRAAPAARAARRARGARGARRPRRRLGERVGDGAAGEHEALAERVGGEPVGAVQAGARGLADRVQAGERRPRVEVGDDPAHHVVRGRGDGDQLARRDPGRPRAARATTLGKCAGSIARMSSPTERSPVSSQPRLDRARDLVARRELVDEALAGGVVQRRALAADRLGDEEALAPGARRSRPWDGTAAARGRRARRRPRGRAAARCPASRAGWSCAPTAPRRRRWRSRPRARATTRPSSQISAAAALARAPQRACAGALEHG